MASAPPVIIISGPTASGKSAAALALAGTCHAWVINADAMQCYAPLPVLSAQPSAAVQAQTPHYLYGFAAPYENLTAAAWVKMVIPLIKQAWQTGALPVLCGGTGFYLKALTQGMAAIPAIDPAFRQQLQLRLQETGLPILYQELQRCDPVLAARFNPTDTQRILRGLEVYYGTGTPLSIWHSQTTQPALIADYKWQIINPPRAQLWQQIETRFAAMEQAGVLAEVALANIPAASSAYKTHGYRELKAYLAGEMAWPVTRERTILQTRQYAKRQTTWLRGQSLIE